MLSNVSPNGVCYDLPNSPYTAVMRGYRFHFSTPKALNTFRTKAPEKIAWLNDSLSKRFRVNFRADLLALFQLYEKCETRGYYVVDIFSPDAPFTGLGNLPVLEVCPYGKVQF